MNRKYRRVIIAANWKMNKTIPETKEFVKELKTVLTKGKWCDVVLAVPFTNIQAAVVAAKRSRVIIAAQNMSEKPNGAYTGEVSADMLVAAGVKYVIIGHSERRQYFGETDTVVNEKVKAALAAGLTPIICVGETKEERDKGLMRERLALQVKAALCGIEDSQFRKVVIAYEPIWAIGTGETATTEQADEACEMIREFLRRLYGARSIRSVEILYGGSVKPSNIVELLNQPNIDGGLIGGASLDFESFKQIIENVKDNFSKK